MGRVVRSVACWVEMLRVDFNAEDAESMERTEMTILQSLSMGVGDDLVASMVLASAGRQAEVCPTFVDTPHPLLFEKM
jgi:hypothetical protein